MEKTTESGIECSVAFEDSENTQLRCSFLIGVEKLGLLGNICTDRPTTTLREVNHAIIELATSRAAYEKLIDEIVVEIEKISPADCRQLREHYIANIIELVKSANMP